VTLEGRRPLVTEVQALVVPTSSGTNPRRATSGLDSSRVAMVLAVLQRHGNMRMLMSNEVYASTVGGARLTEPACDLAIAMALSSAAMNGALPPDTVAMGEVGLAGEIRPVAGIGRRLQEAFRLGFRTAFVPVGTTDPAAAPDGMAVYEVADVPEALGRAAFPPLRVVE
jgi:DNA repair protein RadA/Sms